MLTTRSAFYYGYTVDATSNTIRMNEGSGDIDVTLPSGKYTLTDYINAVSIAINAALTQDYTIAVDRVTRLVTISAPLDFELKIADIFPLNSGYPIMGFTVLSNLSGSNAYTSDSASGSIYLPQFFLQRYVDFEDWKEFIDGSVKESANGLEEIVSFGLKQFMEFDIKFITDREMGFDAPIENNNTAIQDTRDFMDYLTAKGDLEFMKDRDDRNSFLECRLERTSSSSKGIGYKLKEPRFDGYFETGKLKFRKI